MPGDLIIRGGDVVDGTGAAAVPRRRAGARRAHRRGRRPTCDPTASRSIDASGAVVTPGLHRHPRPHRSAGVLGPVARPRAAARRHDDARRQLQPVAVPGRPTRRAATSSDLFAYIEDVPRHLFDDSVPWTWNDYAGYRDAVDATRRRHQHRRAHGPQPVAARRDGRRRVDRVATPEQSRADGGAARRRHARGRVGPVDVVPRRRPHGRPVPSRAADERRVRRAASTRSARSGTASSRCVPGLLGADPEIAVDELARSLRRARHPAHVDGLRPLRRTPRPPQTLARPRRRARRRRASASTRSCRRAPSTSASTGTRR